MINTDIIIIGAGPSGLFTALNIKNKNVIILEKNKNAGIKLLMSGTGKCNITHSGSIEEFSKHYGENYSFIKHAIYTFSNKDLIDYFEKSNIEFFINKTGKYFPVSENSKDILDVLLLKCNNNYVNIYYKEPCLKVFIKENKFHVISNKHEFIASILVLSTGGKSYPTTGSTGDGYNIAKYLGHTIIKPKPALTPVFNSSYNYNDLAGISFKNIKVSLYRNNKIIKQGTGDILFTHTGLSGPIILDLSRYYELKDTIKLNLIGKKDTEFNQDIIQNCSINGKNSLKKYLHSFNIPEVLIKNILELNSIDINIKLSIITKEKRKTIVEYFTGLPFLIERIGDFNIAMATNGGVELSEISAKTMQSKLIKNLYITGELLNIDGDTGGYNLQTAFSTAFLAAANINKSISE